MIRVIIVGAGTRGNRVFSQLIATYQTGFQIVGVVEQDAQRRADYCATYGVAPAQAFATVEDFLAAPRLGDIVFICTPDVVHFAMCKAISEAGYDVLLEKPIATTLEDTLALIEVERACQNRIFVAHVLRYAPFFRAIRELIRSGAYGAVQYIHVSEHIGHWHYAHSYVRGAWRRADESAPIVLTKCSHDLDLIPWLLGTRATSVSSTGSLRYFTAAHAPAGATARCVDCPLQDECVYSATRFYVHDKPQWPFHVIAPAPDTPVVRRAAIETGPFGRCVYRCDNDVCDNQLVTMEFADGVLGTLGLHAHTAENTRRITVLMEHAELTGDVRAHRLQLAHFTGSTDGTMVEDVPIGPGLADPHGGGDLQLLFALAEHLQDGSHGELMSSLESSVPSHVLAFLAERSRARGGVRLAVPPVHEVLQALAG